MRKPLVSSILLVAAALTAAACASKDPDRPTAADATWSTWPGSIELAGQAERPVSFVIRLQQNNEAGSFLYTPPGGEEQRYEMEDMDWDGMNLDYAWTAPDGTELECRLQKRSSTLLTGDCLDRSRGRVAVMEMRPPPGRLD